MKLQSKYNRVNVIATISILVISGFCYFFIFRYFLTDQLDDDLKLEEQEIRDYVNDKKILPDAADYKDQKISFESASQPINTKIFTGTLADEHSDDKFRQLVFSVELSGKYYKVRVAKSQEETDDLIELIVWISVSVIALLMIVLLLLNRFLFNKLWLPFINTLTQIKQFNLSSKTALQLTGNDINEFKELNEAVTTMSEKVIQDYDTLKGFTENASHEMQTPLAVINAKVELLMQSENFSEQQMNQLQVIHEQISRLSKLNKSLLLLTKIDNDQFHDKELVDIGKLIDIMLIDYEELIAGKMILVQKDLQPGTVVHMNEMLAQMLVSNLLINAVKHNIEKGSIDLKLKDNFLTVSNSGGVLNSSPEELFERFTKVGNEPQSLGLGLSIVKKICDSNGFTVNYFYKEISYTGGRVLSSGYNTGHFLLPQLRIYYRIVLYVYILFFKI